MNRKAAFATVAILACIPQLIVAACGDPVKAGEVVSLMFGAGLGLGLHWFFNAE